MMLEIDLGIPRAVSGLELALGPSVRDFPRGLSIETSADRAPVARSLAWHERRPHDRGALRDPVECRYSTNFRRRGALSPVMADGEKTPPFTGRLLSCTCWGN